MHEIVCAVNRLKERIVDLSSKVEFLSKSPSQQLSRKYLDNESASQILHVSKRTLAKMRKDGTINFSKVRRKIIYQASDIHDIIEKNFKK